MNLTSAQAHETYIGPPSKPVDLAAFLQSASRIEEALPGQMQQPVWSQTSDALTEEAKVSENSKSIEELQSECCVDDLRTMLEVTIQDPRLMSHISRLHDASVYAIYETAEPTSRKRKRPTLADSVDEDVEVAALRLKHEAIKLKCWPLTMHAASFIRPPRQPDRNTLTNVKKLGSGPTSETGRRSGLVFVTVFNRQSWGPKTLTRASQHVLLASQSLGDLFDAIPCTSHELPEEIVDDSGAVCGYRSQPQDIGIAVDSGGAVMCVEDVLYGDGQSESDYAEKLLRYSRSRPEEKQTELTRGPSMYDAKFSSLTVRLHQPYWMLHAGNCEHFFTVTTVRLLHPSDPKSGYPLTTQITPPLRDNCRVCTKVPAAYSIVGDIRLGESSYLICGPCWRWMGEPQDGADVLVVPLPKHELGWFAAT